MANCVTTGNAVVCDTNAPNPWTTMIGTGPNQAAGTTVTLDANAQVVVGNATAISVADNATITLSSGSLVQNNATNAAGPYNNGADTIEFRNNSSLLIQQGATVSSIGSLLGGEDIAPFGTGNTITNNGTITTSVAGKATIWFQYGGNDGSNTVINNATGVISVTANGNIMGSSGNAAINFTNMGTINGNLVFSGGNDTLNLYTQGTVSGFFNGGGGSNTFNLYGTGTQSISGAIQNFQFLNKQDAGTWTLNGAITGATAVHVLAGTLVLNGSNAAFTGLATVDANSTLQGSSGSLPRGVTDNGQLLFAQPTNGTYAGVTSGTGTVTKQGAGTLTLSGANTYSGGTTFNQGLIQAGSDGVLGAAAGVLIFNGGGLQWGSSFNLSATRAITLNTGGGTFDTQGFNSTIAQDIGGGGPLTKAGTGTLTLAGTTYASAVTIGAGTLQLGNGGTTGSFVGGLGGTGIAITDNGTLAINHSDDVFVDNPIKGTGGFNQLGTGTTTLSGTNTYTGATNVTAGGLSIDGDQSGATGATAVSSGATLGGAGTLGGSVTVANGGILSPGDNGGSPGTLTIKGDLGLSAGSILNYSLGQVNHPGGSLNDLTEVGGNLTLGGTINVAKSLGGSFGPGIYRVFDYTGALTNNGLVVGTAPSSSVYVQTSVANQVNLVNTAGLTLNFWDGVAGPKNDSRINGGNGSWQNATGNDNWTTLDGTVNAPYSDAAFAVFEATPGTVTVDNSLGTVTASGMQFASSGYTVQGNPITLVGSTADPTHATVVVDDGTATATATVNAVLTGAVGLVKSGAGTLVLGGTNTYTGGTQINAGGLQIASDANLGTASGGLGLDNGTLLTTANLTSARAVTLGAGGGTVDNAAGTTFTLSGVVGGNGGLTKTDTGTAVLTGANTYTNGTTLSAGTLQVGGASALGTGALNVTGTATLGNASDGASLANAVAVSASSFTIDVRPNTTMTLSGPISGGVPGGGGEVPRINAVSNALLVKADSGTLVLTGANTYTGGTEIDAGTLQLGNGGTSGSIVGDVTNNSSLAFNRSDAVTFGGVVSGTGSVNQLGSGATVLTGTNTYTGTTTVNAGALYINGDQSAATGATTVASGATLGGTGTIGGNVTIADGATLSPGGNAPAPGTLTVKGNLGLSGGSILNYSFGQPDVAGGPLNDLTTVGGNLTLDGTLNVTTSPGGNVGPGVYRVFNYGGTLTDNGLTLGAMPASGFTVQTSVANQVNLVNINGLTLNYWDGDAGPKSNGAVNGGNGTWQNASGNTNWTDQGGSVNAAYADRSFAIFEATPGTVTVDNSLGPVTVSGMQFASNGYVVQGDPITLAGTVADPTQSIIRVGDGTTAGAADIATLNSVLTGTSGLTKTDAGTLVLGGTNTYTGGTAINGGVVQIASDANLGDAAGGLSFDGGGLHTTADVGSTRAVTLNAGGGTVTPDSGTTLTLNGVLGGSGGLTQNGAGTTVLTGANSYTGATTVNAGTLTVNGDQSAATGITTINNGGTLRGTGILGGAVSVADGGTLAPGGAAPGTLTVNGNLSLSGGSILTYRFGQAGTAGGALNDLTQVNGNLTLDGTLNVSIPPGGSYGPGVYRVFNYTGTLTDNGLTLGTLPAADNYVQTSVANQVNLINTTGLALNYWDGDAGPKNNSVVDGGKGTWQATGNDNWTNAGGTVNAPYSSGAFAIFEGKGGTVSVDNSVGQVTTAGMQFAADGYTVQGDPITLVGSSTDPTQSIIRVGDGTTAGAGYTATISSVLTGTSGLTKTDAGTLVLGGANTYTGGTTISAGTLELGNGGTTGNLVGNVTDNGTLAFNRSDTVTFDGTISGSGGIEQRGSGTTVLTAQNAVAGPSTVREGTLAIGDATHPDATLAGYATPSAMTNVVRSEAVTAGGGTTTVLSGATLGGYGTVAGDVVNQGTVAVADAVTALSGQGAGQFTIHGTLTNAGLVQIGGAGVGNTLAVTNYVGQNGRLAFNTVVGGDDSPSDHLVIDGGTASGTSSLQVNNVGGQGAATPGNGILLVDALNGGSTAAGAFTLSGRVVAGPYQYTLVRGGRDGDTPDDWYLRTELPATAHVPPSVNPLSATGESTVPEYRPEVSTYTALSSMMANFGRSTLGTLHERVGDESSLGKDGDYSDGVWARVIGQDGKWNAPSGGIYRNGPSFDDNFFAVQAGGDLFHEEAANGSRNRAGLYGVAGHGYGDVDNYDGTRAGSNRFDAYSFGVYWTHFAANDAYVDTLLQGSWYRNIRGGTQLDTSAFGVAASVEGGYPFQLRNQWRLEPQAQLIYQGISVDDSHDTAAEVRFGNVNSIAGRVGARLARTWLLGGEAHPRQLDLWVRANVWHEFSANPKTELSSENGYVPFESDLKGSWYEISAGINAPITRITSLYANLGYQKGFTHGVQAVNGSVGVRVNW